MLGNGSFVLVALSFMSTDILTLRVLNVAAGGKLRNGAFLRSRVICSNWIEGGLFLTVARVVVVFQLHGVIRPHVCIVSLLYYS